jgi:hypothetical protein
MQGVKGKGGLLICPKKSTTDADGPLHIIFKSAIEQVSRFTNFSDEQIEG